MNAISTIFGLRQAAGGASMVTTGNVGGLAGLADVEHRAKEGWDVSAYLTVPEVAELIRAEHRTVRRAIKSGELPAAMIGGRWLIRESAVDEWFDSQRPTREPVAAPRRQRRLARNDDRPGSVTRLRAMEPGK